MLHNYNLIVVFYKMLKIQFCFPFLNHSCPITHCTFLINVMTASSFMTIRTGIGCLCSICRDNFTFVTFSVAIWTDWLLSIWSVCILIWILCIIIVIFSYCEIYKITLCKTLPIAQIPYFFLQTKLSWSCSCCNSIIGKK